MPAVISRLLAEHRDLRRLVALLERQPSLLADAEAPNIGLLVDAMFYLTRFPDVTHHPLEDRITERLLARRALDADLGADIEAQHARLARQGLDLLRDLEGALREESMSRELVADNMRLYAERLRHNMAFEELTLFPAAARHLITLADVVVTTIPSVQTVEHDVCSFGIFSILTMQTRQEPSMPRPGAVGSGNATLQLRHLGTDRIQDRSRAASENSAA